MENQQTRTCPLCRKDVPTEPDPDGGEVPVFKSHPRGLRMGACDLSGKPVDTELTELFDESDGTEDDGVREGHGKPSKPLGGDADA